MRRWRTDAAALRLAVALVFGAVAAAPRAYLYREGIVRLAPEPYAIDDASLARPAIHVTNTALHQRHPALAISDDEGNEDGKRDADFDDKRHAFRYGCRKHEAVFQRHEADDLAHRVAPRHHHQQAEKHDGERECEVLA